MKTIAILFSIIILLSVNSFASQNKSYQEQFSAIDSLLELGLPREALPIYDTIFQQALKTNDDVVLIRSITGRNKIIFAIEEEPLVKILEQLQSIETQMKAPVKQVLNSLIAEVYWTYYQQNRWRFHQRTTMNTPSGDDIRNWELSRLLNTMLGHLSLSLSEKQLLLDIPIENFSSLLEGDSTLRYLRPTLYDVLAHRTLEIIENPEVGLTNPVDAFTLNQAKLFSPATEFVQYQLSTSDTLSLLYQSIQLYQQLSRFRLTDSNAEALTELELNRINYVFNNSQHPNKDSLTIAFYRKLQNQELPDESKAEVIYRLALHLYSSSNKKENRLPGSIELCNRILIDFPATKAAEFAKVLKASIEHPALMLVAEMTELPKIPFRTLLTFKNLEAVHFAIYKISSNEVFNFQHNRNIEPDSIAKFPLVRKWVQPLPFLSDYLEHKVEVPVNGLPKGFYLLVATNPENKENISIHRAVLLQVSSLTMLNRIQPDRNLFVVANAQNGLPVKNAQLELFNREYNNTSRNYTSNKLLSLKTNAKGEAVSASQKGFIYVQVSYKGDSIIANTWFYHNFRGISAEKNEISISYYTDRAIYRPGQTVHFKGIVLQKSEEDWNVLAKHTETVLLRDVNRQEIGSMKLTSNEYGTFSGSFILPRTGLNGNFSIECQHGSTRFLVEEYRRPTFEVKFDQPDRSFTFGDSVNITGLIKEFSGTPVDAAKVSCQITRREERLWWRWQPALPDKVIAVGETISNAEGAFSVSFFASDSDIDDRKRIIVYQIEVQATDRNGETQTNSFSLRVSETNLLLQCDLPEIIVAGSFKGASLKATNLNGEEVSAKANLTITRLNPPRRFLNARYWAVPDTFLLNKKAFNKTFPGYPYREENKPENWEQGKTVFNQNIELPLNGKEQLSDWLKTDPGYYRVVIQAYSPDSQQTTTWSNVVRLIKGKASKAEKTDDWITGVKTSGEPGETAEIWITAINPKSPVRYELVMGKTLLKSEIIVPGKKVFRLLIPIDESYRGNVAAQFTHVANNRRYLQTVNIEVPHSDKKLDITFNSFRDHLLPGEKEQWSLTLSDHTGKGLAAEMVATLYDASLEQFARHSWQTNFLQNRINKSYQWFNDYNNRLAPQFNTFFSKGEWVYPDYWFKSFETMRLLTFNTGAYSYGTLKSAAMGSTTKEIRIRGLSADEEVIPITRMDEAPAIRESMVFANNEIELKEEILFRSGKDLLSTAAKPATFDYSGIALRSNFNETAFFYPHLYSNKDGKLDISFTIPEAITRWRMMGFAHTRDFKHGSIDKELITRKQVSISAYTPRFLRESDTLTISSKVTNLTGETLSGTALLQWSDAITFAPLTAQLVQGDSLLSFTVEANSSAVFDWRIIVPQGLQAVTCKVVARAGSHTDGEQKTLPVLTNRQMLTESMPFMVRGRETENLLFDKMANHRSATLTNHAYTIEYTSNPAWYAIQSLPYLMEYPHNCSEQVFSRLYANAAATGLVNSSPRIKAVFDAWKTVDTGTFLSNLEKNSELKSVLLEESPWLLNAKSEAEAKQRIGLFFDLNRMSNEQDAALDQLKKMQSSNGGFPWFSGMPDNRYITQYIAKSMGEMMKMNLVAKHWQPEWETMRTNAMTYLDARIAEDYKELLKQHVKDSTLLEKYQPSLLQVHYLYTRSFYPDEVLKGEAKVAFDYYYCQAKKQWLAYGEYAQGLLSLTFHRFGDAMMANRIVKSLGNRALRSRDEGMHWKNNRSGYFWYQAPIETQALLINVFSEVAQDTLSVEEMKIWLLRNKQSTHWKTTKATMSACYALLNQGFNLLGESQPISVKVDGQALEQLREIKAESGTGYVKTVFEASEIKPGMARLEISNPNRGVAWGAAYWQYFEQLDKITKAKTDVEINKHLFVKEKTGKGNILKEITSDQPIHIGDEVVVRIEISTLRDMEYVHLKDLRAAGFEPTETVSGYRWQDGLGYYQEIKDASVNFFISYLAKGKYVFEYSLRASHSGKFSNGITSLQSMYAPEFSTHSEGIRIEVEQ